MSLISKTPSPLLQRNTSLVGAGPDRDKYINEVPNPSPSERAPTKLIHTVGAGSDRDK